jgi:CHAD domain-containing protein
MSSKSRSAVQQGSGPQDGREVEWQLAATDLGIVRHWLAGHGAIEGLVLEPPSTLQIVDTYLDTDDWRIHRAGFALRVRSESGKSEATLKSLHSASAGVADRRELTETLENSQSESIGKLTGRVGTRVQAVTGEHALRPLFEVRTTRQRHSIRKADEVQPLGEIALDDTVIAGPHGEPETHMQRVEVEVLGRDPEPLESLVKTLRGDCALEMASDSKYSQGLKVAGLVPAPAPQFAPTVIHGSMPMVEVAQANLRRYLSVWHSHEFGARLGDDPEELHDLRVAARRLDGILRQFQSSLPASFLRIRPIIKKVMRTLGDVRDLDVALSELEIFSSELLESDRAGVEPLKRHLVSERGRVRARMLSVLDSVSVQSSFQKLASLLATAPPAVQQSPGELALKVAPDMIRPRYRKLRKRADNLTSDSSAEAYHEVRGQVKKLRCALDAVAVIYGKPADEMLRTLRRWQESLGVQQDAAVASRRLAALAVAPPKDIPPETLFLMGRLAEHYVSAAARARKRHAKGYRKVRRRWRRLRSRFEALAINDTPGPTDSVT